MNTEEKILALLERHSEMLEKLNGTIEKQDEVLAQHGEMLSKMQDDITGIKACLDYDVNKRFDAVNEGIDAILEQLTPKSRVDALEADIVVLKTAVKMLTQEVNELKKAQ